MLVSLFRAYNAFENTAVSFDELQHVTTGLELLENGTYELEALHPPLARIIAVLPLYFFKQIRLGDGFYEEYCSLSKEKNYKKEYEGRLKGGELVFCSLPEYELISRIKMARFGSLIFFFIGGLGIYSWSVKLSNRNVGILATFFYANLPIILASCITVNTDMAGAAFLVWTLHLMIIWLANPKIKNSFYFGLLIGLTAISKYSDLIFFVLCFGLASLYLQFVQPCMLKGLDFQYWRRRLIIMFMIFITIWLAYGLSVGAIDGFTFIPFPEFFRGLGELVARNHIPFLGYIWGKLLFFKGAWYFFPVATIFKTPLSFLIILAYSSFITFKERNKLLIMIFIFILSIYLIGALSNINIGLRHMLPAFMLMCIPTAYCVEKVLKNNSHIFITLSVCLCMISFIFSSFKANDDFISYFNILAGESPEDILIEGDFDIGQDAHKLSQYLKDERIDTKTIFYSYNMHNQSCYGFNNNNHIMLFGKKISTFQIKFSGYEYLAVSRAVLKFIDKSAYKEISKCHRFVNIGKTVVLYKRADCMIDD